MWPFISVKVLYTAAILEIKMTRLTLDLPGVRRVLSYWLKTYCDCALIRSSLVELTATSRYAWTPG